MQDERFALTPAGLVQGWPRMAPALAVSRLLATAPPGPAARSPDPRRPR